MGPVEVLGGLEGLEDTGVGEEEEDIAEGGEMSCYGMMILNLHCSSASGKVFETVIINYKRTIIRVPLSVYCFIIGRTREDGK